MASYHLLELISTQYDLYDVIKASPKINFNYYLSYPWSRLPAASRGKHWLTQFLFYWITSLINTLVYVHNSLVSNYSRWQHPGDLQCLQIPASAPQLLTIPAQVNCPVQPARQRCQARPQVRILLYT